MPIGFWAVSRNDLKLHWAFLNERYPAEKVAFTEHDLDMLGTGLPESLDGVVDQETRVQMAHRRFQNRKR